MAYVEGGEYVDPDPTATLQRLGTRLCRDLRDHDPRLAGLAIPAFDRSLAPLVDFVNEARSLAPDLRVLFVLDEFDELPIELFKRGPLGDSFFLTLRTLSGKPRVGLALVGGERMELILNAQGDQLNKFRALRVDYFDKESHWTDFVELVRKPVHPWLEYDDQAIERLYEISAGNPFFTKLVCMSLYRSAVRRRDAHLTEAEVDLARLETVRAQSSNAFQHFWEDGILDTADRVEQVSVDRRKVLLALGNVRRRAAATTRENVVNGAQELGLTASAAEALIGDFVRRQVLEMVGSQIRCKVSLFEDWLVEKGANEILTTFMDPEAVDRLRRHEQEAFVRAEEVVALIDAWPTYKGRPITEDRVRQWLDQFEGLDDRRLMFKVLVALRFRGSGWVRERLREAHEIVRRGITRDVDPAQRKRREVLVSYLDGPGKSGATYAKLYAEENNLLAERVVELSAVSAAVETHPEVQAVVFVDDFIGTGEQSGEHFSRLADSQRGLWTDHKVRIYFVAISGYGRARDRLNKHLRDLHIAVDVRILDPLGDDDRIFSANSRAFSDSAEAERAKEVATRYGGKLEPRIPLGYGGCEAPVVFDQSIPNNALPILWSERQSWRPLFPRR